MAKDSAGKVLIVDDEFSIRRVLHTTLAALSFEIEEAITGEEALAKIKAQPFDAILLDINMPGIGGMAACREIRKISSTLPILMLTVRGGLEDIVSALDAGADDYVTKPFHVGELTARIRTAVRRNRAINRLPEHFRFGQLELDVTRRMLTRAGRTIHLTPKEFDLLHYLMAHSGVPVPHAKLLRAVWGPEYGGELEYLRTFIRQLRLKIEDDPSSPVYLLTEPHIGYRFADVPNRSGS
ncbi:MAG TPA: response regulator transcription factor [Bryobacteraceae bacterium]|jgi:two-component system KDP operon response regulator KdpE|nr:response regulator transcription factor [Bryobacteraceae bacterium]